LSASPHRERKKQGDDENDRNSDGAQDPFDFVFFHMVSIRPIDESDQCEGDGENGKGKRVVVKEKITKQSEGNI